MTTDPTKQAEGALSDRGPSPRPNGSCVVTHGAAAVSPTHGAAAGVDAPAYALERAAQLTCELAGLEERIAVMRADRLEVLRQATAGLPVASVAARLGMSRQRVYAILRNGQ